jgi:hypothetical protein
MWILPSLQLDWQKTGWPSTMFGTWSISEDLPKYRRDGGLSTCKAPEVTSLDEHPTTS